MSDFMTADEIHAYAKTLRCPKCYRRISNYSLEGDYICNVHGFVSPITDADLESRIAEVKRMVEEK